MMSRQGNELDLVEEANRNGLDVRLVAFLDGRPAGTITLRESAFWMMPEYGPGLGGLFAPKRYRGRGIGSELARAGMQPAREQGYERAYATTVAARGILERLGWKQVLEFVHEDERTLLYVCVVASDKLATFSGQADRR